MSDGEGRTFPGVLPEVQDKALVIEYMKGCVRSEVLGHESAEPHAGGVIGEEGCGGSKQHHVMDRHRERLFERDVYAD